MTERRTAVNPQTGERVFWDGERWSPEPPIPEVQTPQLAPERTGGVAGDILLSTAEGVSLGTLDEMAGAIGALLSEGVPYEEAVKRVRQRMSEIPTATRVVGNIAGGALTLPAAGVRAPATVAQAARQGAATGALAGAGFTEGDLPERAAGAAMGAVTGGALGAGGQAAVQAVGRAIARARQGVTGATARALDDILGELRANEITPQQAIAKAQSLGPEGMLADVPELQRLAQQTASKTATGARIAGSALRQRARGGQARIDETLDLAFQGKPVKEVRQGVVQSRKANAQQLYDDALKVEDLQRTPALASLLDDSALVKGQIASIKRSNPKFKDASDTNPQLLHEVRVALGERSKGQGAQKRNINDVVQQLTDAMDEAGAEGYRQAVDTYRSDSLTLEAFDQGRKALNELPENVQAFLSQDLPQAERDAYIAGIGREVARRLDMGETAAASQGVRSLLRGEKADVLREAFGDQAYNQLRNRLLREVEFAATATRTTGGSPTQPRQAAAEEMAQRAGRIARTARTARQGGATGAAVEMLSRSPAPRIPVERARAQALFRSQQPGPTFAGTTPLEELAARELNLQGASLAPLPQLMPGAAGTVGGQGSSALLEMLGF